MMRHVLGLAFLISVTACSPPQTPVEDAATQPASAGRQVTPSTLTVFNPHTNPVSIVTYAAGPTGASVPNTVIEGPSTELAFGNGVGVDSSGNTYVIAGSPNLQLLTFALGANGDVAPSRVAQLPQRLQASGLDIGFGEDGLGNVWVVDIGTNHVVRFSLSAVGTASPNAVISPRQMTPHGLVKALAQNVTVGPNGNVYVSTIGGAVNATFIGVSEYSIGGDGSPKLLRSFYDQSFPRYSLYGPKNIAVDANGFIYLSGIPQVPRVYVYAPKWRSGPLRPRRSIDIGPGTPVISAIAVDAGKYLYVAFSHRINIYAPNASNRSEPIRSIIDPVNIQFYQDFVGTYLSVH